MAEPALEGSQPVDLSKHPSGIVHTLQNIVSTVNLDCKLDLKAIALQARNAEYNPKRFAAVIMRIREPKTTALIFASGNMLVGGNSALALAMTVASNLLGIIIVPLSLARYIGTGAGVSLPTEKLFRSLVTRLLIPLIIGKVAREASKGIADFVDRNQQGFSVGNAVLLSLVPWIQISRSRSLILSVQVEAFAAAITVGVLIHLALLAFNIAMLHILSRLEKKGDSVFAKKQYTRAVILVSSQKTLPVMITVVEQLGGALGESGLLVIPCVFAHINQIIVDSIIVNWWRRRDQQFSNPK